MSVSNYAIITFLKENRGREWLLEDVEKGTHIKISASPQLLQNLKDNPSINYREDLSAGADPLPCTPFFSKGGGVFLILRSQGSVPELEI